MNWKWQKNQVCENQGGMSPWSVCSIRLGIFQCFLLLFKMENADTGGGLTRIQHTVEDQAA